MLSSIYVYVNDSSLLVVNDCIALIRKVTDNDRKCVI